MKLKPMTKTAVVATSRPNPRIETRLVRSVGRADLERSESFFERLETSAGADRLRRLADLSVMVSARVGDLWLVKQMGRAVLRCNAWIASF